MITASVIIPNLHSPHLADVIHALRHQTIAPLDVIVIGQDRYGLIEEQNDDPWLRIINTGQPTPPARARNVGISYARGQVVCFLDSDCVPHKTWLEQLLIAIEAGHPIVSGGIWIGDEQFWQRCDNIAALGPFLVTAPAGERPYLITASAAMLRNVIANVGWFDESFPNPAGEDPDLAFRLRRAGYPIWFEPNAQIVHRTSRSDPYAIWQHIRLYGVNWPILQQRYSDLCGSSLWQQLHEFAPFLAFAAIPLMTIRDTYEIYLMQPQLARRYWPTIPFVYLARMAWYIGRMSNHR